MPPAPRQHASRDTVTSRGFSLVTKQLHPIMQADGTQTPKANLAIEIVLDMFNTIDHDAMAMVVRGHGDPSGHSQATSAREAVGCPLPHTALSPESDAR